MTPIITCFITGLLAGGALAFVQFWHAWRKTKQEILRLNGSRQPRHDTHDI